MVRIHLFSWIWNTVRTSLIAAEETDTNCDTNWLTQVNLNVQTRQNGIGLVPSPPLLSCGGHSSESCKDSHYGSRSGLIMPRWRVGRILWRFEWKRALLLVKSTSTMPVVIFLTSKKTVIPLFIWIIWIQNSVSRTFLNENTTTTCGTNLRKQKERYAGILFEFPNTLGRNGIDDDAWSHQ